MVRNPKLEKLKDRLSPTQQFSRRERMKNKGTFRQESEKTLAQHAGGINMAFKGIETVFKKHRNTRYGGFALTAVVVIDYIGRYLGTW